MTGDTPRESRISLLTCPECRSSFREVMPEDRCVVLHRCSSCGADLRPESGDCCVFCSYGSRPCPPVQDDGSC